MSQEVFADVDALVSGTSRLVHETQPFQAGATVRHCLISFKVKIQLDHYCIGNGSYISLFGPNLGFNQNTRDEQG